MIDHKNRKKNRIRQRKYLWEDRGGRDGSDRKNNLAVDTERLAAIRFGLKSRIKPDEITREFVRH